MRKIDHLYEKITACINTGRYLDTRHAFERQNERKITRSEVLFVLRNGYHEKKKDRFVPKHQDWTYSVRGKTVDCRELRIIVAFDESNMLIITSIDLDMYFAKNLYG